jgi:O-antigen/teichoic acid export membrane protein
MSSAKRVARNTSLLTIGQIINYGEGAIYAILVARYLGANGLGILNLGLALTAVFGVLATFGLTMLTTREVAKDRSLASKYVANLIPMQVLLGLATIGLIVVLVNAVGYSQQTIYVVYILSVGIIVSSLSSLLLAVFQAFEQLEFQSAALVITSVVPLCGVVIAIQLHLNVVAFALLSLLAGGTGSVVGLVYVYATCVRRFFVPRLEADFSFWKGILTEAWPMAATGVGVIIFFRIDVVMISVIHGTTAVGFYSVAYTLSEASLVVPTVFITSLFPVLSRLLRDSKHSFRDVCAQAIKYMIYLALPMAFFVTLWAKPIVSLLYGARFDPSVVALQILIWFAALMYVSAILGTALVAANLQKLGLKITIFSAVLNICLNVILIPKYSYFGASFATVGAAAAGLPIQLFFLGRHDFALGFRRASLPPFFGLAVLVAISALLYLSNVPLALITVVGLVLYGAIIHKFGLNEEDRRLILSLLNRSRPAEAEI